MTQNIAGFGTVVIISADKTFPTGLTITQFADDADPLSFEAVRIADTAMGVNGDLLNWARATPLPMALNVIPGGPDDVNLQILADANRVGQGKAGANDIIRATVIYPDGTTVIMTGGVMTDAQFGLGISSSGRKKTKAYAFAFETKA